MYTQAYPNVLHTTDFSAQNFYAILHISERKYDKNMRRVATYFGKYRD
jgi:hypothetical protein